ncbi:MAG: tRNA (adenosine(37)-N6)-threonylcarbamoyltransferase complex dimerization subunit type 1 TsaB [Clostridia bacterium]|nr:tRNA (adenosine(37)-N6)-threonylcarbamoyltransferase complex dimerization subunit type 1 TsaB [Clostridia bacterium]
MKILSVECSAGPASVALLDGEKIAASSFVNVKLTHSQTLVPMIKNLLESSLTSINDIDAIAVAVGPGSFTGIRIGIGAIKGLAAKDNIPCIPVSTLRGMAEPYITDNCIVCAVMDARCNQVYNALFRIENNKITRLCEDRALMCNELADELNKNFSDKKIIVTGDGADLFYPFIENLPYANKAPESTKYQNAIGIALAAREEFENGNAVTPAALLPVYLRLPQAERELKKKLKDEEKKAL